MAAHPNWIERLALVLRVTASAADQRRYHLDGLHCVTNDYLHCRVAAVLRQFDLLIAASVHLPPGSDGEPRRTL